MLLQGNNKAVDQTMWMHTQIWVFSVHYGLGNAFEPLSCWTRIYLAFANSVDPDQLASEEANWSGSALFAVKYVSL